MNLHVKKKINSFIKKAHRVYINFKALGVISGLHLYIRVYILKEQSYSLNYLDLKLEKWLNFENGFFIEAGGNDGISQSNTLNLEKKKKWRGILIEPVPSLAAASKNNRPGIITEAVALVGMDYQGTSIKITVCHLMSTIEGHNSQVDAKKHLEIAQSLYGVEPTTIEVPAVTLTSILEKNEVKNIDLLSLDVEGFEAQALKGLDFSRYAPKYILVEVRNKQEIDSILGEKYREVAILTDNKTFGYKDILYKLNQKNDCDGKNNKKNSI